jgi:hypothetical protein
VAQGLQGRKEDVEGRKMLKEGRKEVEGKKEGS